MMVGVKQKVFYLLYNLLAKNLPMSCMPYSYGFRQLRNFLFRKSILSCGENPRVEQNVYISPRISVGNNVTISENVKIRANTTIGNDVLIGPGVHIITVNHGFSRLDVPMRFAISNKPSLSKFDLYDNAEMLYLSKLIGDRQTIEQLEKKIKNFYSGNNIYSMIDFFGMKKNKNMLRWAVMPYVLAKSL